MSKKIFFFLFCFVPSVLIGIKTEAQEFPKIIEDLVSTIDPSNRMKGKVYSPKKINPSLTVETAKKNLRYFIKNVHREGDQAEYFNDTTRVEYNWIKSRTVIVTDDYFEFETGREGVIRINFKDILLDEIVQSSCNLKIGIHNFGSCASPELPDAIYFLRDRFEQKLINDQMNRFELIAEDYRKSPAKHELSEIQRKYFIQGNAMVEAKQPVRALMMYNEAFTIDPLAYPEGYYNMALIAGVIEKYRYAIFCMKKYLMLVLDATDLQAAKDKIYEWEALLSL